MGLKKNKIYYIFKLQIIVFNDSYNNSKDPLGHCFPGLFKKASPTLSVPIKLKKVFEREATAAIISENRKNVISESRWFVTDRKFSKRSVMSKRLSTADPKGYGRRKCDIIVIVADNECNSSRKEPGLAATSQLRPTMRRRRYVIGVTGGRKKN